MNSRTGGPDLRKLVLFTASCAWLSVLTGSTASHASWTKIYGFDKSGSSFDVVQTLSGDSLNDLFSNGYDGTSLSWSVPGFFALDVGTLSSTAPLQDHLVRGMLGLSGYDPFINPGQVTMIYNSNVVAAEYTVDYRYLSSSYNTGITANEVIDLAVPIDSTQAFVINRGTSIPEPNTAILLALGLWGMRLRQKHSG